MNELCLFAGGGGGLLATKWLLGWRTCCYVEIDPYCIDILKARIRDGLLDDAPIWDDARTFDGRPWCGSVDCVTAGFPCQPFSTAGKRKGESDERNLWPETIRIIREVGPRFCLLENVPALLAFGYYGTILGQLSESGFDVRWKVVSAAEVGAPHKRDRVWILAYADKERWKLPRYYSTCCQAPERQTGKIWLKKRYSGNGRIIRLLDSCVQEAVAGGFCRMDDELAEQVDRLRALGNGQVPSVVAAAWEILSRY